MDRIPAYKEKAQWSITNEEFVINTQQGHILEIKEELLFLNNLIIEKSKIIQESKNTIKLNQLILNMY